MGGQVVAVASGKGGVGKTTTVVNLGVVLRRANHSVALVDADLGMANLGPMLGIETETTLHHVLAGEARLEEALVTEAAGFAVLPGSQTLTDFSAADPRQLGDVIAELTADYDYVLVDTGAGMTHEGVLPLGLADRVVLVTSPDPAAVDNTRKTAELTGMADGLIAGVVVTKAGERTDAADVAAQVGVDLLGVIPFDPTVRRSTASGRPLEAVDPDSPAVEAYRTLAEALTGDSPGGPPPAPETADADPPSPDSSNSTGERAAGSDPDAGDEDTADRSPGAGDAAASKPPEAASPAPDTGGDDDGAEAADTADAETTAPAAPSDSSSEGSPSAAGAGADGESPGQTDEGAGGDPAETSAPPAHVEEPDPETEQESAERSGFFAWLGGLFR